MTTEHVTVHRNHIFVINHDSLFLEMVRELLQMEEYAVTTTNFVPSTFHQILGARPDVVIVDLKVNEQACWTLLEQLNQGCATRSIPVIVVSTDSRLLQLARDGSERYAGDRFLTKPLDVEHLLAMISDLLGKEQLATS
jgi:DNA-binding response OmpR family regulator